MNLNILSSNIARHGFSAAKSTLHKPQPTVLAAVLAALPALSQAACPTYSATQALAISGETCSYAEDTFSAAGRTSAVIDVRGGGSATFSANRVQLHKSGPGAGNKPQDYSVIYLRDELDNVRKNRAVFEGDVVVEQANVRNTRDIVVGGGGDLHIRGDLSVTHGDYTGSILDLGSGWNGRKRQDTSMTLEGKLTANTAGSDLIRLGYGTYRLNGGADIQGRKGVGHNQGGRIRVGGAEAELIFGAKTVAEVGDTFIDMVQNQGNRLEFNELSLTIEEPAVGLAIDVGSPPTPDSPNGKNTLHFKGDATIKTPHARAIELKGGGVLQNDGKLAVTEKEDIAVHATAAANTAAEFKNTGSIERQGGIARHHGDGKFAISNTGSLKSTGQVYAVRNEAAGVIDIKNGSNGNPDANGLLQGSLHKGDGELNLTQYGSDSIWRTTDKLDSFLTSLSLTDSKIEFAINGTDSIYADRYEAKGGTIVMNTTWNDDAADPNGTTQSNRLIITDLKVDAATQVKLHSRSIGNITPKNTDIFSEDVIVVNGKHEAQTPDGHAFFGTAQTDGAQQVQLVRNGNNYRWTLKAGGREIIAPEAAHYVQTRGLALNLGLEHIGMLHQRVGSRYQNDAQQGEGPDVWVRTINADKRIQDKDRFGARSRTNTLQIGADIHRSHEEQGSRRTGLMLAYSHADHNLYDKYRATNGLVSDDKYIGSAKTDIVSAGVYHTRYAASGGYLDLVGQISWLKNRHRLASQQGYAVAASAEVGKPFLLGGNWYVEPQAQLVYQYQYLNGKHDGVREIADGADHRLTARVGSRLMWRDGNNDVYLIANLIRPFGRTDVRLGNDVLVSDDTRWKTELGLGGQIQAAKGLSVYGDVRYVRSLGKGNRVWRHSNAGEEGAALRAGLRYRW